RRLQIARQSGPSTARVHAVGGVLPNRSEAKDLSQRADTLHPNASGGLEHHSTEVKHISRRFFELVKNAENCQFFQAKMGKKWTKNFAHFREKLPILPDFGALCA